MGFDLMWALVIEVGVELMRSLELKVVELALDDHENTRCVLCANQFFRMRAISLAVIFLYIEVSWRAVAPIVAQSIGMFYPSRLSIRN